jgi:excisionase family DNA binding protein
MTKSTGDAPLTMSVPEAGKKYFDLSRDSSYRAAERGEIPTIRVGRLLRVPVRAMERLLDGVERTGADAALATGATDKRKSAEIG